MPMRCKNAIWILAEDTQIQACRITCDARLRDAKQILRNLLDPKRAGGSCGLHHSDHSLSLVQVHHQKLTLDACACGLDDSEWRLDFRWH